LLALDGHQTRNNYIVWLRGVAEVARDTAGIRSWIIQAARCKWSWAGHVARMNKHRWASRLTIWRDSRWWAEQDHRTSHAAVRPLRSRPGHFSRWEAELCKFSLTQGWPDWRQKAAEISTEQVNEFSTNFAAFANKSLKRGSER